MNVDLEKGSTSVVCVWTVARERKRDRERERETERERDRERDEERVAQTILNLNLDKVVVLVHVIQQNGRHSFSKLALSFASLSRS